MAVNTIDYAANLVASTQRGPSESLWNNCPVDAILQDPALGTHFFDDMTLVGNPALNAASSIGQWASWADTSATITDGAEDGGVAVLTPASTSGQIVLGSNAGSFRMVSGATGFPLLGKLWFECRVAIGSITTAIRDLFVGLVDNTTTQVTSAANLVVGTAGNVLITTPNLIGFHFRDTTNPTDVGFAFNVAGGTVQYPTNLQTLSLTVAGAALTAYAAVTNGNGTGFIKLGFLFDPAAAPTIISSASSGQTAGNTQRALLKVFVNGLPAAAFLTTTNVQAATFPTGRMAPVIAFGAKSTAPKAYIDWIRVAQLATF
jgi:hypothetical protein